MPRFFVEKQNIADGIVTISGEDAHHIARSLRMAAGEHITVCDMDQTEYDCVLEQFDQDKTVYARITAQRRMESEPPISLTVYQALPKADKLDTVIQKSVECGAVRIVPFESEYCVVRAKADAEDKKMLRRQRIALEAAKQCGRGVLPTVEATCSFEDMLARAGGADLVLFCYEGEGTVSLKRFVSEKRAKNEIPTDRVPTVSVIIGSEGGFSNKEVEMAKRAGCTPVGLGARILRTETVSSFVLGCLIYEFEL